MLSPPRAIYWRLSLLILVACLSTLLLPFDSPRTYLGLVTLGALFGTAFQQAMLAATWLVLGPGKLRWRVPASFAWACLAGVACGLSLGWRSRFVDVMPILLLLNAALWLGAQLPLWGAARLFALRLWHQGEVIPEGAPRRQFGIRQLMIITAVIAVLLGIGRAILLAGWFNSNHPDVAIFTGLGVSQVLQGLPLILACLLPRWAVLGVVSSLLFIAGLTVAEIYLFKAIMPAPAGFQFAPLLIPLNGISALWVLIFAAVVRASGYHLGAPQK
jgi:hypothetical protein